MQLKTTRRLGAIALAAAVGTTVGLLAGGGSATAQSGEIPKNTVAPSISGTQVQGEKLSTSAGTWTGTQPMTFAYQWLRCTAALANCLTLQGATNATYTLTSDDVGKRLIASVTATNSAGGGNAQATTETIGTPGTAPANTAPPTITGTATSGQTLTANKGTWTGTSLSYAYQWQRCDAAGNACAAIGGATAATYALGTADVGKTIRVIVTGWSAYGSVPVTSAQTAAVAAPAPKGPEGQVKLPNGMTSIPATSVALPERLIVDRVSFSPSVIRTRAPFTVTFRVVDTRGYAVRDALVFVRSTPLVTTTPAERTTGQDGTITLQLVPEPSFRLQNGYAVQFFVRARKAGGNVLAGISTRRLVQVRTATPAS